MNTNLSIPPTFESNFKTVEDFLNLVSIPIDYTNMIGLSSLIKSDFMFNEQIIKLLNSPLLTFYSKYKSIYDNDIPTRIKKLYNVSESILRNNALIHKLNRTALKELDSHILWSIFNKQLNVELGPKIEKQSQSQSQVSNKMYEILNIETFQENPKNVKHVQITLNSLNQTFFNEAFLNKYNNIETLHLTIENSVSGCIFEDNWYFLRNLKELCITSYSNCIINMCGFYSLEKLALVNCVLDTINLKYIEGMHTLDELIMQNCRQSYSFINTIYTFIMGMRNEFQMDLRKTNIKRLNIVSKQPITKLQLPHTIEFLTLINIPYIFDVLYEQYTSLTNLRYLHIDTFNDNNINWLLYKNTLNVLKLYNNPNNPFTLDDLYTYNTNLYELELNQLNMTNLNIVKSLRVLYKLEVDGINITDANALKNNTTIEFLALYMKDIVDIIATTNVKELFTSDIDHDTALTSLPNLNYLNFFSLN